MAPGATKIVALGATIIMGPGGSFSCKRKCWQQHLAQLGLVSQPRVSREVRSWRGDVWEGVHCEGGCGGGMRRVLLSTLGSAQTHGSFNRKPPEGPRARRTMAPPLPEE